jgi:hypothetical protein
MMRYTIALIVSAVAFGQNADLVLRNGKIVTLNPAAPGPGRTSLTSVVNVLFQAGPKMNVLCLVAFAGPRACSNN